MSDKQANLIGGRRLARNVLWNLLGTGAPLLVAIVAIPMLIEGLGTARFGILTLAWMVVGYFSLFDLGLGRALTKLVAEKLGMGQEDEIPALIWTAMSLMAVLGVLGAVVVAALSPWLVGGVLKVPAELQPETLTAFYLLAASIPIVIGSTGLRGILEAHQRFGLVNAVRIPLGIFTFLGPVAVLVIARLVSWGAHGCNVSCLRRRLSASRKYRPIVSRRLKRDGFIESPRCASLEGEFSLWQEYTDQATEMMQQLPNHRVLKLRYEHVLEDPVPRLRLSWRRGFDLSACLRADTHRQACPAQTGLHDLSVRLRERIASALAMTRQNVKRCRYMTPPRANQSSLTPLISVDLHKEFLFC